MEEIISLNEKFRKGNNKSDHKPRDAPCSRHLRKSLPRLWLMNVKLGKFYITSVCSRVFRNDLKAYIFPNISGNFFFFNTPELNTTSGSCS